MTRLEPIADVSTLARQTLEWIEPRAVHDTKAGGDVLPKTCCLELQEQLAQLRLAHHFGAPEARRETQEGHRALCEALHWDSLDTEFFVAEINLNRDALTGPPQSPLPIELPWEPRILQGIRVALRLIAGPAATLNAEVKNAKPTKPENKQATVNERMAAMIQEDPSRVGWSASKWALSLGKSKTAVQQTATWKRTIRNARALGEARRAERGR